MDLYNLDTVRAQLRCDPHLRLLSALGGWLILVVGGDGEVVFFFFLEA